MTTFKEMPLDTTLQKGDVVTITGPGEHDVMVREVTGLDPWDGSPLVAGMFATTADMVVVLERDDRTQTRIQRPVPALPTVEGDYIFTTTAGIRYIRSLIGSNWWAGNAGRISEAYLLEQVENGATLTRVVPADEAKRPEVDMEAVCAEFQDSYLDSSKLAVEVFEDVLLRVLGGEFDL